MSHLDSLEAESIHIIREVVAEASHPVMLYSIGKDSSVMVRLAQKAFYPGKIPFPLLHIDTTYKFRRNDRVSRSLLRCRSARSLIVHTNRQAIEDGASPFRLGTQKCCGLLKTRALLDALRDGGYDAAFGGARRDEEKSRAKERVYSFRDRSASGIPRTSGRSCGTSSTAASTRARASACFPLSNWTELDVWEYIDLENIPIVPLYFAKKRPMVVRGETLIPVEHDHAAAARRAAADGDVPHALAGLHVLHRRHPLARPTRCPRSSRR